MAPGEYQRKKNMSKKIKVLMFGWEFPPHISGGLGTACYGLTKGLMKHNTEVHFVVPKAYGDEDGDEWGNCKVCTYMMMAIKKQYLKDALPSICTTLYAKSTEAYSYCNQVLNSLTISGQDVK